MKTNTDQIYAAGVEIRQILDGLSKPDRENNGPYRLYHADIHGNEHPYADGATMDEKTVRRLMELFMINPHHQTYRCEPHLPYPDAAPQP